MKIVVFTMGNIPQQVQRHAFTLPFGGSQQQMWHIGINPHRSFSNLLPSNEIPHEVQYGGNHYVLSVPSGVVVGNNLGIASGQREGKEKSDAEYFAYSDAVDGNGTHYGWLLQLLEASPRHSAPFRRPRWLHELDPHPPWAYTSRHRHVGDGNGYAGPTEYFLPAFGSCDLYASSSWQPLTALTIVKPKTVHQLRCSGIAINLLLMWDIRDPDGVRSKANHEYCPCGINGV